MKLFAKNSLVFCALLMLGWFLWGGLNIGNVQQAVAQLTYQTVDLEDGTDAYTTTTYTSGYLAGDFTEIAIQVNNDVSGTGTITITPQFSNDAATCSATGKSWADALAVGPYTADASTATVTVTVSTLATQTLTTTVDSGVVGASSFAYGSVTIYATLTGDDGGTYVFPVMGKCGRIKFETSTTFTPTAYLWMAAR